MPSPLAQMCSSSLLKDLILYMVTCIGLQEQHMCMRTDDTEAMAPLIKKGGMNTHTSTWCGKSFGQNNLYAYQTVKQVGRLNESTSTQAYADCRDCKEAYSRLFHFESHCFRNVHVEYTGGIIVTPHSQEVGGK